MYTIGWSIFTLFIKQYSRAQKISVPIKKVSLEKVKMEEEIRKKEVS